MEQIANTFGVGAAFALAVPFYVLFKFLNEKASDEAKAAIASYIKGDRYKSLSIGDAVASAFEHIYGRRLLHPLAFLRSALLTMFAVFIYEFFVIKEPYTDILFILFYVLPPIVISDYLSLFAVRKALEIGRSNSFSAIILAMLAALVAISLVVYLEVKITDSLFGFLTVFGGPMTSTSYKIMNALKLTAPAFLVHLWLPLFLVGSLMNYLAAIFFRFVGAAQWFVTKGDQNPLEAVGIMASIFVFVAALVAQKLSALT